MDEREDDLLLRMRAWVRVVCVCVYAPSRLFSCTVPFPLRSDLDPEVLPLSSSVQEWSKQARKSQTSGSAVHFKPQASEQSADFVRPRVKEYNLNFSFNILRICLQRSTPR